MASVNFEYCLTHVLKSEGGYVNHPSDPGGRTNRGVTQKVWESWVGRESSEAEMRSLTDEDVAPLYRKIYWNAVKGDDLPSGVDLAVFDFAVNSGVARAARFLQKQVGVSQDGNIGSQTLLAVYRANPVSLIKTYCAARQDFLESLNTFSVFGKGWTRRVSKIREDAIRMAQSGD